MFVKRSLREELDCLITFFGIRFLCLLPVINRFLKICLSTLFAALLNLFLPIRSNHHPQVLQSGLPIYVRKELLLSQKLVQVHRILFHAIDQYLYSMESHCLEATIFLRVFSLKMNTGSSSEHQNKSSITHRHERCVFITRVAQVNVKTWKKIFGQQSKLQAIKRQVIHVLSSS